VKNNKSYDELIAKHLSGETSPQEEQQLFEWLEADEANKKFFEDAKQLWTLTAPADEDFGSGNGAAWQRITDAVEAEPVHKPRVLPLFSWQWRAAAAVFILLAGTWWFLNRGNEPAQMQVFASGEGEKLELMLPDSSIVTLNENSRLEYAADFSERLVQLTGEAFFEVTRQNGARFTVRSGDVTTTVLGTAFNVRAYPDEKEVEVAVEHGKVAVALDEAGASEKTMLTAGEAVRVFDEEKKMEKVENPNAMAWRNEVLYFDDNLMREIIPALERYFDREIVVEDPALLDCHYTSTFVKPRLDEVLDVLSATLGFEIEAKGDSILLKGHSCR
jgi:ferric-dicitrate binding protein FerR (iron transport regulator)